MILTSDFQLRRHPANPILSPNPACVWESLVATNPAAWHDEATGEVLLLYRCAGEDAEHIVRLGLARSRDGVHFERDGDAPVVSPIPHTPDGGCVEDPRIVRIGDWYYVTVACRPCAPGRYWEPPGSPRRLAAVWPEHFPAALRRNLTSTHLLLTKDFRSWIRAGRLTDPSVDDRDVVIFPETVGGRWITLHRPMGWHGEGYSNAEPAIWIAATEDVLGWKRLKLLAKAEYEWERKLGANNPPLRTPHGWLQVYHAVGPDRRYRLGALLLDLEDPFRVTHRTRRPIYQPEAPWETKGLYNGVCFPCGHAVLEGVYHLYYGGGDVVCGLATTPLDALLANLLEQPVA
jgi:beta-1,2-mannobiose phosphorylase / 1,2-beta-oligomannan phosphorylase